MKYRAEIDGLRAFAVTPVVFFHAGFEAFHGGFIGVDVFFVISGYLITDIIYNEIKEDEFSIVQFYERRIRRILPPLILVSLACIPFAWMWMMPDEFVDFSKSLVAVGSFVSNIFFWQESGYFDLATGVKPLLHTWSLAVEEQFYLVFPMLLILLRKFKRSALLLVFFILVLVSLLFSEWASRFHPSADFYFLPSRAWELGVGAFLAIFAKNKSNTIGLSSQIAAALGLCMIAFSIFFFDETVPLPGFLGLIPVLGTALVIMYAESSTVVGRILSWRPIVGIGLISYGIYLWHQPLFAFARIRLLHGVTTTDYLVLITVAVVLAYSSWRFVEKPFRNRTIFSRAKVFSAAGVASAAIIAFGVLGYAEAGFPTRLRPGVVKMAAWANGKDHLLARECDANANNLIRPENSCISNSAFPPDIAIWGDSHALALSSEFAKILLTNNHGLREFIYSGCAPIVVPHSSDSADYCPKFNYQVLRSLISKPQISTIVLVALWTPIIEGKQYDNLEGSLGSANGIETYDRAFGKGGVKFISNSTWMRTVGLDIRSTIEMLLKSGKRVVLVYPVPEVGWDVPRYLAREIQFDIDRREPLSTSFDAWKKYVKNTQEQLDMLQDQPNLVRVHPEDVFCNTYLSGRCVAQLFGKPLYFDDNHLNSIGAGMLVEKIVNEMKAKGWLGKSGRRVQND